MAKNFYETLGVDKKASADEIKSAYRRLAKQYHPDANPGNKDAEAKFKEINVAYETLSDPNKKANYDRFGESGGPQFGQGGAGSGFGGFTNVKFDFSDLGDIGDFIFNSFAGDMFGGMGRRSSMRGGDIHASITLSFFESANGTTRDVSFSRMEKCTGCNGTGAKDGTHVETCPYCEGTGRVRARGFAGFATVTPCSACNATGRIIRTKCGICNGKGAVKKSVTYAVKIPAGIMDGQTINIDGEGDCAINGGVDGINGSLLISVRVTPHPILVRDNFDLYLDLPITFTQSILGCRVKIPTIDGTTEITIPPYTQNGTKQILRGKGIKRLRQIGSGDLIIKITVEMPRKLDRRGIDIIKSLDQHTDTRDYEKVHTYKEKMSRTS